MSYSLAVKDGDLVQEGSSLGLVFGADKLTQDIRLWITERHGGDRFHVNMGSILQEFIGGVADESTIAEVQGEINRILDNYMKLQRRKFKNQPQSLSASEMLAGVKAVKTIIKYDTVDVQISLQNYSQQSLKIAIKSSTN
jgi:hypothetical protein